MNSLFFKKHNSIYLALMLTLSGLGIQLGWCQEQNSNEQNNWLSSVKAGGQYFIDGILNSRYKKPGWREYIMPDRLEIWRDSPGFLNPHPRLITRQQIQQARLNLGRSPYRPWYLLVRQRADAPITSNNKRVKSLAEQAKAGAFIFYLERDVSYRKKALSLLERLPDPPSIIYLEGGSPNTGWGDFLQSAEAIPDLCVTYDLLFSEMDASLERETARKILGVVNQLVNAFKFTPRNNHVTVMAIAVATASISIDNPSRFLTMDQHELFRAALEHLSQSLGLIAPDGGYGEGPYYARYILNYLAPFSVHLQNVSRIKLFEHPYMNRLVNWALDNEKGNGNFTQFDDAFAYSNFFLPLIIHQENSGNHWNRFFKGKTESHQFSTNMIEALGVYRNPTLRNRNSPFFVGKFYPDIGQVLMKDRAVGPRFFASFTYERESYFADVHEQIDPLSFELSAAGEDWILDGGYGTGTGDPNRTYFLSPSANSTILVDGHGTNPNPLIGDELGGHLAFAFSTPRFAASALQHKIGDVQLTRQIFYSGASHMVVLDQMIGESPHQYTVQFKYLGDLIEKSDGQWELKKNQSVMNIQYLADNITQWQFQHDRGLGTGIDGTFEHNVLGLRTDQNNVNSLVTIWQAGAHPVPNRFRRHSLLAGEGEWRRLVDQETGVTEDMVWNRLDSVKTEHWQTDARFSWVKYTTPFNPDFLLLVDACRFRMGPLNIQFSRPVTLFLEKQGSSWAGYVHMDNQRKTVNLKLNGINVLPVQINEQQLNVDLENSQLNFKMTGSGRISFGIGEPLLHVPRSHYPEYNFLQWLNGRPGIRKQAEFWSDYERRLFKNQITRHLLGASSDLFSLWGKELTGDSMIFHKSLNIIQGISQYSYRTILNESGLKLPHRYALQSEISGFRWQIREEGDWRMDGVDVRDLEIGVRRNQNRLNYRFRHYYNGYQQHKIAMDWQNQLGFQASTIQTNQFNLQNYYFYFSQPDYDLKPSFLMRDKRFSTVRLDTRYRRQRLSFRAIQLENDPQYLQTFIGRIGSQLRWLVEGMQIPDQQMQEYRSVFSGKLASSHYFTTDFVTTRQSDWNLARGLFSLNGVVWGLNYFQSTNYVDDNWYWTSGVSGQSNHGFWTADIRLKDWQFEENSAANLNLSHRFNPNLLSNFRLNYSYKNLINSYTLSVSQKWNVKISGTTAITPLWNVRILNGLRSQQIGFGLSFFNPFPFLFHIIQNRSVTPYLYQTDTGFMLPLPGKSKLNVTTTFVWSQDALQYAEIQLSPISRNNISPGIYYRWLRPYEQRLEGFIEWRW